MGVSAQYGIRTLFGVDGGLDNVGRRLTDVPRLHTRKGTFRENKYVCWAEQVGIDPPLGERSG